METLGSIRWCVDAIKDVQGDMAECGVYHGLTAKWILEKEQNKILHLFDVFTKFDKPRQPYEQNRRIIYGLDDLVPATPEQIHCTLSPYKNYELHVGFFKDTFPLFNVPLSFIHSDADTYDGTADTCRLADRLLVKGGIMAVHDYGTGFIGVKHACDEYMTPDKYELIRARRPQAIFKRI